MRLEVAGGVPHQHQEISVGLGSLAPGWDAPWLHLPTQNHLGQDLRLPGLRVPSGCPWAQQHLSHARIKLWAYILVVAGVVVMVTGVLGCCATFKERRNLLRLVSRVWVGGQMKALGEGLPTCSLGWL